MNYARRASHQPSPKGDQLVKYEVDIRAERDEDDKPTGAFELIFEDGSTVWVTAIGSDDAYFLVKADTGDIL
jgi:hypothetical protein